MAQTFVKVGVNFVGVRLILLAGVDLCLVPGEFLEDALGHLVGGKIVCMGDVGDGYAL